MRSVSERSLPFEIFPIGYLYFVIVQPHTTLQYIQGSLTDCSVVCDCTVIKYILIGYNTDKSPYMFTIVDVLTYFIVVLLKYLANSECIISDLLGCSLH